MADVTREEFDALAQRVNVLEGSPGSTPPRAALMMGKPTVKVTDQRYEIIAQAIGGQALTLKFAQIAVRGPGAQDLGHRPNLMIKDGQTILLSGSRANAEAGDYTAYMAYSVDGETWSDGPKATFTIKAATPAPPAPPSSPTSPTSSDRPVPRIGASGLPFNSIVFTGGNSPGGAEDFGKWRGVPVDGILFFTSRGSWDEMRGSFTNELRDYAQSGKLVVVTLPHAPQSEGDPMNQRGANNDYASQQQRLAKEWTDKGVNLRNVALRINWELNGSWYPWSANRPGGSAAAKAAFTNAVKNFRAAGLTKTPFDMCFNKGPSQAGSDFECFPGREFCDVIGVDQYDMWSPSFTDGAWTTEINKRPGLQTVMQKAKSEGVLFSLDEGGNTHGDSNMGGDNPFYWTKQLEFFRSNPGQAAWHTTYNHAGAPATLHHDFASNPRSAETYKQLIRP